MRRLFHIPPGETLIPELGFRAQAVTIVNPTASTVLMRVGARDIPNMIARADVIAPPATVATYPVEGNDFGIGYGPPAFAAGQPGMGDSALVIFSRDEPLPEFGSMPITRSLAEITNAVINVSGAVNAHITNATLPVSGGVNANITNAVIPVSGTLDANIINATVPVSGSLNANITNAVLATDANITNTTVAVSGNVNANITNATVPVSGSLNANITNANINTNVVNVASVTNPADQPINSGMRMALIQTMNMTSSSTHAATYAKPAGVNGLAVVARTFNTPFEIIVTEGAAGGDLVYTSFHMYRGIVFIPLRQEVANVHVILRNIEPAARVFTLYWVTGLQNVHVPALNNPMPTIPAARRIHRMYWRSAVVNHGITRRWVIGPGNGRAFVIDSVHLFMDITTSARQNTGYVQIENSAGGVRSYVGELWSQTVNRQELHEHLGIYVVEGEFVAGYTWHGDTASRTTMVSANIREVELV